MILKSKDNSQILNVSDSTGCLLKKNGFFEISQLVKEEMFYESERIQNEQQKDDETHGKKCYSGCESTCLQNECGAQAEREVAVTFKKRGRPKQAS